jgi:hypothetical protein
MAIKKLNAEWHRINKMPKNPTLEQRLDWHREHEKYCACREMPRAIRAELDRRLSGSPGSSEAQ